MKHVSVTVMPAIPVTSGWMWETALTTVNCHAVMADDSDGCHPVTADMTGEGDYCLSLSSVT